MLRFWLLVLVLIGLTAGVYHAVWRFGFVDYDDFEYVTNSRVQEGLTLPAIGSAFVHYRVGNYAPLVSLSYGLDQTLFHMKPGPMHVENVLLHLLCGLLLWRFIFVTTGALHRGFAVAAIFLVHPMHVESVAWIAERKDVLSTSLLLGTMLAYVKYCRSPDARNRRFAYSAMLVMYALSLLAKAMGTTLPAVLLLMDVWPLRRSTERGWSQLVVEKIPLIATSIGISVITGCAQYSFNATSSLAELNMTNRINNALVCYAIYIAKLAVPINLAVFYVHPQIRPWPAVLAAAGLLLMMTALFFWLRKSRPFLMIGWLWFLGTLVPVNGLVQVGSQSMADRYSYFPSIGLSIIAVWFLSSVLSNTLVKAATLGIVLGGFSVMAWKQVSYWQNTETLFTHAAIAADPCPVAHMQLGNMAFNRGDLNTAFNQYLQAMTPFDNPRALNGMGLCVVGSDPKRAIGYFRRAIRINPSIGAFHADLANALWHCDAKDEARTEAHLALSLDPNTLSGCDGMKTILDSR